MDNSNILIGDETFRERISYLEELAGETSGYFTTEVVRNAIVYNTEEYEEEPVSKALKIDLQGEYVPYTRRTYPIVFSKI